MRSSESATDMAIPDGRTAGLASGQLEGSANAGSAKGRSRQTGRAQPQWGGGANRGGARQRGRTGSEIKTAAADMGLEAEESG